MMRVFFLLILILPQVGSANEWINIPAGSFLMGSTRDQIDTAYQISARGYGHDGIRKAGWFNGELPQKKKYLPAFRIQKTPVTQIEYQSFVHATGHKPPYVDKQTWQSYGLVHPYSRVTQYLWQKDMPPKGKEDHPVVLVTYQDATDYAAWLSKLDGHHYHLPSEAQWEKAMRGKDGWLYPWGNTYDSARLNNADQGPFATMPVGSFPQGASPYGVFDGAGQVFEWTSTRKKPK